MMYVTPTVAKRSMGSFQNTVRAKDAKPCSDLVIECPVTTRAVLDFSISSQHGSSAHRPRLQTSSNLRSHDANNWPWEGSRHLRYRWFLTREILVLGMIRHRDSHFRQM